MLRHTLLVLVCSLVSVDNFPAAGRVQVGALRFQNQLPIQLEQGRKQNCCQTEKLFPHVLYKNPKAVISLRSDASGSQDEVSPPRASSISACSSEARKKEAEEFDETDGGGNGGKGGKATRRGILKALRACRRSALRGQAGPAEAMRILHSSRELSMDDTDVHRQLLEIFALSARKGLAGSMDLENLLDKIKEDSEIASQSTWNGVIDVCLELAARNQISTTEVVRILESKTQHGDPKLRSLESQTQHSPSSLHNGSPNSEDSCVNDDGNASDMTKRLRSVIGGRGGEGEGRLWIKLMRVGLACTANNGTSNCDGNGASNGRTNGGRAYGAMESDNGAWRQNNGALQQNNEALEACAFGASMLGQVLRVHAEGEEKSAAIVNEGVGVFVALCVVLANRRNAQVTDFVRRHALCTERTYQASAVREKDGVGVHGLWDDETGPCFCLFTDASPSGWGALLLACGGAVGVQDGGPLRASGRLTPDEQASPQPLRETAALCHALSAFAAHVRSSRVLHVTDSQPAVDVLAQGCERDTALDSMAARVREELASSDTTLHSVWVEARAIVDVGCDALSRAPPPPSHSSTVPD